MNPHCPICADENVACDFVTRCGHNFHESCLMQCTPGSCPYCRQGISFLKWAEKLIRNMRLAKLDQVTEVKLIEFLESIIGKILSPSKTNIATTFKSYGKSTLEELTKFGWDINSPDQGGQRLLAWICDNDDIYRLNLLLDFGLDLPYGSKEKQDALNLAKSKGSSLVYQRLNEISGLDVDEYGNTSLHEAVCKNDFEAVKALIENDADIEARNFQGNRPLHLACSEGNLSIVELLIEKGALIDCYNLNVSTPLSLACVSNKAGSEIVFKLLKAGAKTDLVDIDKHTLFHITCLSGKFDVAAYLLNYFNDANQKNVYDENFLHVAAYYGPATLIEAVIELGVDINAKDFRGNTPLNNAMHGNTPEVVKMLLKKGADPNIPNKKNQYPIMLALKRVPRMSFVKALLRNGANVAVNGVDGISLLELALENNY